jgi:predicted amidohydrolase YtcJ
MLATIERAAHEHPAGTWLRAELSRAAIDDPALTREALDKVAPQHPVWIDNFAGHALVLNTAALHAIGVDLPAQPPPGGFIGRNGDGAADGWLFEYARYAALRKIGELISDTDVLAEIDDFETRATAFGITTVQALPTMVDSARLEHLLRSTPRKVRWHVMRVPLGKVIAPPLAAPGYAAHGEMVHRDGTKYFLDGMLEERGAALSEPYADHAGAGRADWDAAAIDEMLYAAAESRDPLHLHIAGDLELHVVLDMMDVMALSLHDALRLAHEHHEVRQRVLDRIQRHEGYGAIAWPERRLVIEHGDGISASDIPRIRALGIVVVQNPSHSITAELNRARLGARAEHWMPMRSLVAAGIHFALGSDGPLNPFLNILWATQHPTNPREALTREQALVAYTQGSAYDEQTEHFKGRLVPGMVADLAVLSQDLFTVTDAQLPKTRSVLTIVGGRIVHDALTSPASARSSARTE